MKFLLDQNQSPLLAEPLKQVAHDAIHTRDIGLGRAPDLASGGLIVFDGDRIQILSPPTTPTTYGPGSAHRG